VCAIPKRSRTATQPRKGQPSVQLSRQEFERRLRARFYDPAFRARDDDLTRLVDIAWEAYHEYRKSPVRRRAGAGFKVPGYELPVEWLETRKAIHAAERRQKSRKGPGRILLINGSPRSDQTCPGEISKSYRLSRIAQREIERHARFECDFLDLSVLTAEYGRQILPCKACVSTAMPLCHWPCSCYPNHALGQVNDWMNEIYPRWSAAHGVMIVTPVHWYQAPSVLKLMIDRLVCADGGNPDPTTTSLKDPAKAKALELAGWHYPRHLAGRRFAVVVHGDTVGAETLRRSLSDWLQDMHLVPAHYSATMDRYIGYYEPYATSHIALDADRAVQNEVRLAARHLVEAVVAWRAGRRQPEDLKGADPRPK
jgi:multimeric flavodoxin WrbA